MEIEDVAGSEEDLHMELAEISLMLAKKYEEEGDYQKAFYYSEKTAHYKECLFRKQNIDSLFLQKDDSSRDKALEYQKLCLDMDQVSYICRNIASNFDFKKTLRTLYEDLKTIVKLDILSIGICNEYVDVVEKYIYIEDGTVLELESYALGDGDTFGEYCLKNEKNLLVGNVLKEYNLYAPNFKPEKGNTLSLIYIPMKFRNKIKGFLSIQSYRKYNYNREDVYKIRIITEYLAIALENSKYYSDVKYLASHDYLTNLLNRKEIIALGAKEFEKFKQSSKIFSVILMDIDNFKTINDRYGHITGDKVIVKTAELIMQNIRKNDYAGRCGGEEFIIVLPEADQNIAYEVAQRIRRKIEENEIIIDSHFIKFTSSFGVFEFNENVSTFEEGASEADRAMYRAKKTGKNRVCYI